MKKNCSPEMDGSPQCPGVRDLREEKILKQRRRSRNIVRLAILALLVAPSYWGDSFATQKAAKRKSSPVAKSAVKVTSLRDINQLKQVFQRDTGKVRLVTILSPT
jgi:hypothetical protein